MCCYVTKLVTPLQLSISYFKIISWVGIVHKIVHIGFRTSFKCDSFYFPCAGVSVWLRGTNYQNNSLVTLEDIGEGVDALLCVTDQTACCRTPYSDSIGVSAVGNWLFPNGTRVPSSGSRWNFHRTRGHMNIVLHRREGGEEGIYHCLIPDAMTVMQTIYIGVYTASTGEW